MIRRWPRHKENKCNCLPEALPLFTGGMAFPQSIWCSIDVRMVNTMAVGIVLESINQGMQDLSVTVLKLCYYCSLLCRLKTACSGGGGEWKQIQTILSNWRLLSELLWEKLINWFWQLNYRLPWCCVKLNCEWMLLSSYWIGSFTIGIFRPFFNYFSIIFHFILFPFFLKIETQNERKRM